MANQHYGRRTNTRYNEKTYKIAFIKQTIQATLRS